MENLDIRWKRRFGDFERSLSHLRMSPEIKNPDIIQQAGMAYFFETTFELPWNTTKDYLEAQGFTSVNKQISQILFLVSRLFWEKINAFSN